MSKLLLHAQNIQIKFGDKTILDFEQFAVYEGEKIGLVGANGAGKTTLLGVLAGEIKPDEGKVKKVCDTFYFRQFLEEPQNRNPKKTDMEVYQDSENAMFPYEWNGKELSDLNVGDKTSMNHISGGEETRLRLAQAFGSDKPLMFFDEPTSNLDRKGIAVLERKLYTVETMVLVSHDRALLNALCTKIVELDQGKLTSYDGNYDDYLEQKQAEIARQWTEYERYTSEKKRLEKVLHEKKEHAKQIEKRPKNMSPREAKLRNCLSHHPKDAKARRMEKSASNVQQRINAMEVKEKPKELPKIRPDFRLTDPPENRIVIRGENLCCTYKNGPEIFSDASFQIANHNRIAVVGDNGAGKTTLLHLIRAAANGALSFCKQTSETMTSEDSFILNQFSHFSGSISIVPKAAIGFFEQNLSTLDYTKTVLENVMEVSVQKEAVARTVLSRLLFFENDMKKPAGVLSGGERIKLAFARLFVSRINILVLDEPTNYLDLSSIEALETMFSEYEGTLVFVSHDKHFIESVATEVWEVSGKKIVKND